MRRATLRLQGPTLRLETQDPDGPRGHRRFDEADAALLTGWAAEYRKANGGLRPAPALLAIGQSMSKWLDGAEGWLTLLRHTLVPPLVFEVEVPTHPSEAEEAFLEAPWELLADTHGHLAGRDDTLFCPVRRIGAPQAPPAPSNYRLHVMFMAATPEGASSLQFEQEEAAILRAVSGIGIDLVVEDTGTLGMLVNQVALASPVDVLHLSCHGSTVDGPHLLLEDDFGRPDRVTPSKLANELGANLPQRLLFVSACLTADPAPVVGSFAKVLTQRGCPAVLGWGGSVRDSQAMRFATELYRRTSRKEPLETAVAWARHDLFSLPQAAPTKGAVGENTDWHLARLYLGPTGGGALTTGQQKRSHRHIDAGYKEMLDAKGQRVPVASREAFVGRRYEMRSLLREMREPAHAGIVLHGLGGQGKSSLVARLAHRCPEHRPVIVYEHYDALAVLDGIESACTHSEVTAIVQTHRDSVRRSPQALRNALREILNGPCADVRRGPRGQMLDQPILLIVDDFERVLEAPKGRGLHTVHPSYTETVRSLLEAFDGAETRSKLIFTSRYQFTLTHHGRDLAERLLKVHVPPMSEADRRKQALARGGPIVEETRQKRAIKAGQGNPGLQDLLLGLAATEPDACDAALDAIEAYLSTGADPTQERVRAYLSGLTLDQLFAVLTDAEQALMRASQILSLPAPLKVIEQLAMGMGTSRDAMDRLLAFGLWDRMPDPFDPAKAAALLNPLARPRLKPLGHEETSALSAATAEPLFQAWGGPLAQRATPLHVELTRLGLAASHASSVEACAPYAVRTLYNAERAKAAAEVGIAAVHLLENQHRPPPVELLRATAEACDRTGETGEARRLLARALDLASSSETLETDDRAALHITYGRRLASDGFPDQALSAFETATQLLASGSFAHSRAVTLGDIARIRVSKGEVEEALRLHHERLAVFEELGDRRERAVTLGDIARIRVDKGEVEEALRLHHERARGVRGAGRPARARGDAGRHRANPGRQGRGG
ncbi:MAG: CHAT domain-containing protein [Polyangiaceae bacterium]|nr:CHAT domain-containing protein [Polyangiaceae bacterium]